MADVLNELPKLLKAAMEIYAMGPEAYMQTEKQQQMAGEERQFQAGESRKERKARWKIAKLGLQKLPAREQYIRDLAAIPEEQRTPEQQESWKILTGQKAKETEPKPIQMDEPDRLELESLTKQEGELLKPSPYDILPSKKAEKEQKIKEIRSKKENIQSKYKKSIPQTEPLQPLLKTDSGKQSITISRSEFLSKGIDPETAKKKAEAKGYTVIIKD